MSHLTKYFQNQNVVLQFKFLLIKTTENQFTINRQLGALKAGHYNYPVHCNVNVIFQIPEVLQRLGTEFSLQILQINADRPGQKLNRQSYSGKVVRTTLIIITVDNWLYWTSSDHIKGMRSG